MTLKIFFFFQRSVEQLMKIMLYFVDELDHQMALYYLYRFYWEILSFQSDLSASVLLDYEVSSDYFSDAFDGFGEVNLASLSALGNVLISVTTFFKVII